MSDLDDLLETLADARQSLTVVQRALERVSDGDGVPVSVAGIASLVATGAFEKLELIGGDLKVISDTVSRFSTAKRSSSVVSLRPRAEVF